MTGTATLKVPRVLLAVYLISGICAALGGLVPLFNIQLGEIIIGGVGAGLYGMLVFVVLQALMLAKHVDPEATK